MAAEANKTKQWVLLGIVGLCLSVAVFMVWSYVGAQSVLPGSKVPESGSGNSTAGDNQPAEPQKQQKPQQAQKPSGGPAEAEKPRPLRDGGFSPVGK